MAVTSSIDGIPFFPYLYKIIESSTGEILHTFMSDISYEQSGRRTIPISSSDWSKIQRKVAKARAIGADDIETNDYKGVVLNNGSLYQKPYSNNIKIPEGITYIKEKTFLSCMGKFESVTLPSTMLKIGQAAFFGHIKLKDVQFAEGNVKIENNAFGYTNLVDVKFPQSMRIIGAYCFENCHSLKHISFGGVKEIGDYAFSGCEALTELDLGSIERIGNYAFDNCRNLVSVDISSLPEIDSGAFNYCESLTDVKYSQVMDCVPPSAFSNCTSLERIEIPQNVKHIQTDAFGNDIHLSEVILNEGLISIDEMAFTNCVSLEKLTIPRSVRQIVDSAFVIKPDDVFYFTPIKYNNITLKVYECSEGLEYAKRNHFNYEVIG